MSVRVTAQLTDVTAKGFVFSEELRTLEELKLKLSKSFETEVKKIFVKTKEGRFVEVADLGYIRDEECLYLNEIPAKSEKFSGLKGDQWIHFNVGGRPFLTCRSTIEMRAPNSMLARMFAAEDEGMTASHRDSNGSIVIDRSPWYFEPIINYLRTGKLVMDRNVNPEGVYEEAVYFGLESLLPELKSLVHAHSRSLDDTPLSRRDVINAIAGTPTNRELRFQGVNLDGSDLSKLDLRYVNFKYASLKRCNLSGANLSFCNLERADLSGAVMDNAQMLGVKMLCANLEKASLRSCNFDDPAGSNANMEGVNLRDAVLEGSNMARVNLRVATIKCGNLKNCDLKAAVLAGADLEFCNLSGSDLGEANLRGANLKDTALELMQTPLHMSQTIR